MFFHPLDHVVFDGLYVGVPIILGGDGVEKIIEIELTDDEMAELQKSVEDIRENVQKLPF